MSTNKEESAQAKTLGRIVHEAVLDAVDDWSVDFAVEVNASEYDATDTFEVCLTHRLIPCSHSFYCRVVDDGDVEIEMNEECWTALDQGSLFALMWFELASRTVGYRSTEAAGKGGTT